MKSPFKNTHLMVLLLLLCGVCLFNTTVWGKEIRLVPMEDQKIEAAMQQKAARELHLAQEAAAAARQEITRDRKTLDQAIARLTKQARDLKKEIKAL
jgi:chromosomal replication initiation ATPase DnaA